MTRQIAKPMMYVRTRTQLATAIRYDGHNMPAIKDFIGEAGMVMPPDGDSPTSFRLFTEDRPESRDVHLGYWLTKDKTTLTVWPPWVFDYTWEEIRK